MDALRPRRDHGSRRRFRALGALPAALTGRGSSSSDDTSGLEPAEEKRRGSLVAPAAEALPGLARIAGSAAWHTTAWSVKTGAKMYVRTGGKVVRAAVDSDERANLVREAADLVETVSGAVGAVARTVSGALGPDEDEAAEGEATTPHTELFAHRQNGLRRVARTDEPPCDSPEALRARGAELLDRSRDVWSQEQGHPAYARILEDLAPDEARILLLLVQGGPQPSVDVRTGGPGGMVNSSMIAAGLSMIGPRAGLRYPDRVPAYLNNLFRLGLVWFSKEPLRDHLEYQVLEAQPDVLAALHSVKFAKIVRRSIHLTPFGDGFARMCLLESAPAELPEHSAPSAGDAASPPAPH